MLGFIGLVQTVQSQSSLTSLLGSQDALHVSLSSTFIFLSPDSMFLFCFPVRSFGQTDVNSTFKKAVVVLDHA